jgi:hypothetical protein
VYSRTQISELCFSCKQDVLNPRSNGRRLKCIVKCMVMCTEVLAKRINFLLSDYTENDILELLVVINYWLNTSVCLCVLIYFWYKHLYNTAIKHKITAALLPNAWMCLVKISCNTLYCLECSDQLKGWIQLLSKRGKFLPLLACWDCGFEYHRRHGCFSLVNFVLCSGKGAFNGPIPDPEESY